jgi:hypothetical protein
MGVQIVKERGGSPWVIPLALVGKAGVSFTRGVTPLPYGQGGGRGGRLLFRDPENIFDKETERVYCYKYSTNSYKLGNVR